MKEDKNLVYTPVEAADGRGKPVQFKCRNRYRFWGLFPPHRGKYELRSALSEWG